MVRDVVCLDVQIPMQSGPYLSNVESVLFSWFRLAAEQDESLQHFASVGVNTCVSVQFSFLNESERRRTHPVARTFCPDFDHHTEISCGLLQQSSSGETRSLAEELQEASAVFTLWNQDGRTGSVIITIFIIYHSD